MTGTRWIWLLSALLYLGFFGWYTSFKGPLTEQEITDYLAYYKSQDTGSTPERLANLKRFMEEDTGDDFVMVNVIDLYDTPQPVEGVQPGESTEAVLGRYMAFMYPALFARASHPVLFGQAAATALDLMNAPNMQHWTQGAAMRYRSRRDMLEIATNPAFSGAHEFKIASMAKTIAFPIDPWLQLGDPRLVLALLLAMICCALSWRAAVRR